MSRAVRAGLLAFAAAQLVAAAAMADAGRPLADLLRQAHELSARGERAQAYELLAGAEDAFIGEPRYDYALGRAALEAGLPARATLAFSRVLAVDPGHAGALIDMGRAYLDLGNFEQARVTFESLLALDPPPPVRAQLQAYLEQARRGLPARPAFAGYLAAGFGWSSNVNQSPSQSQVFVPLFGARFDLADQNVRKSDRFWNLAGGAEGALPLDRTWSVIGGAELVERQNLRESAFDLGGLGTRLGVTAASGLDLLRVQWLAARNDLGHDANRDTGALSVEGFKALGPDDQLAGTLQSGRIRYLPEDLRIFNANFRTLGVGLSHRTDGSSTLAVGISAGEEHDTGGNPDGNKRQLGLRGSIDVPLKPRWSAGASLAWQQVGYDRENPAFLVERRDRRADLELSLQTILREALSLRFGLTLTAQRSNVPIYEFDRREAWLLLRRDFR